MAKKNKKSTKTVVKPVEKKIETTEVKQPVNDAPVDAPVEEIKEDATTVVVEDSKTEDTKVEKSKNTADSKKEKTTVKVEDSKKPVSEKKPEVKTKPVTVGHPITSISSAMGILAEGERISKNQSILLLSMVKEAYLVPGNDTIPPELRNAMTSFFDMGMIDAVLAWNNQFKSDLESKGIMVKPEMLEMMNKSFETYLGITLKALPAPDGQQIIDFDKSIESAPDETKQAIIAEKTVVRVTEIPVYTEGQSEEQSITDVRSILSMKNGMGNNLRNALDYAKVAFGLTDAKPAKILSVIIGKFDQPAILINCIANAVYGTVVETSTPFAPHCWIKNVLGIKDEQDVSDMVKLILAYKMKYQAETTKADYVSKFLVPYSELLSSYNDEVINAMMESYNKNENFNLYGKITAIKGLLVDPINPQKLINAYVKTAYGKEINNKIISKTLKQIADLYKKPLSPLDYYVEKGEF